MQITCNQFESLLSFYIDGDLSESLKQIFENHLEECSHCKMKYKVISSIISDIKGAYDDLITPIGDCIEAEIVKTNAIENGEISETELSAYVDNELSDESNIKIRKNIIAKPKIRQKIEKMYKLKKFISDSYIEQRNKLKNDYSKSIIKLLNQGITSREIYIHCALFIGVVIVSLIASAWIIMKVL